MFSKTSQSMKPEEHQDACGSRWPDDEAFSGVDRGKGIRPSFCIFGRLKSVASVGVEPTTFALLARRSNRLS